MESLSMLLLFILTCLSICVTSTTSQKSEATKECQHMQKQMNHMEDIILVQQESLKVLDENISFQKEINTQQNVAIRGLTQELKDLKAGMAGMRRTTPDARNAFNALGCVSDFLSLSCPDNRLIQVTRAEYGQNVFGCTDACCTPNPEVDCTEDVATNFPEDWAYLQYLCDNVESCYYEFNGRTIPECWTDYNADYMQIFYDCLPEPSKTVVGFTSWASESQSFYPGEGVLFDIIDSNFGGHYNPVTSTFQCPYHATYMFSVNVSGGRGYELDAQIMREATILASPHIDASSSIYNHASALVITECSPGQQVWVRALGAGEMFGGMHRSLFSGYLMQRLD